MKKSLIILCLTILTASLLIASTAITFAQNITPDLPTNATTNATTDAATDVSTDATTDAAIDASADTTVEATTDVPAPPTIIFNEQPSFIAPNNDVLPDFSIKNDTHICPIDRARESYHRYACDECGNYSRVYHDETSMTVNVKNEWFHLWNCDECGYEYAERHIYETAYSSLSHYDICVECGYQKPEEVHEFENDFYGNNHDIQCGNCGFIAEHHVGVKYETIDSATCKATCSCGAVEFIEHNWDGFVCSDCGYALTGTTLGLVNNIRIMKDIDGQSYNYVSLNVNGTIFRLEIYADVYCDKGDFIAIVHNGNEIFDITVHLEYDTVFDMEHFPLYASSDILNQMDYVGYDSNTVEDTFTIDDILFVVLKDGRMLTFDNFVIYDFTYGNVVEHMFILPGERLAWFEYNEVTYILDIWDV